MQSQTIGEVEILSRSAPASAVRTRRGWYVLGAIAERYHPLEDYGDAILHGPVATLDEACAWWASRKERSR